MARRWIARWADRLGRADPQMFVALGTAAILIPFVVLVGVLLAMAGVQGFEAAR